MEANVAAGSHCSVARGTVGVGNGTGINVGEDDGSGDGTGVGARVGAGIGAAVGVNASAAAPPALATSSVVQSSRIGREIAAKATGKPPRERVRSGLEARGDKRYATGAEDEGGRPSKTLGLRRACRL